MNWERNNQFSLSKEARIEELIRQLMGIQQTYGNIPVYVSIDKVNDWSPAIELDATNNRSAIRLTGNGQHR